MDINTITFPLYKLRSYIDMDTSPIGLVKVTTIKGIYVLDDTSIEGNFFQRRAKLKIDHPDRKVYKLKEKVNFLRQLVKYKSGTTFIDYNGKLIKYKKSSELFKVKSLPIIRKRITGNWTVINCDKVEQPFLVGHIVTSGVKYASIMYTKWGPFLYDLTSKQHEPYKRKI